MEFQRREPKRRVSIRDVLSGISIQGFFFAGSVGLLVGVCFQISGLSETLASSMLIFVTTGCASLASWCVARLGMQSEKYSNPSRDTRHPTSSIRSNHARVRMVTSSVASQINNALMIMMSSLDMAERNSSNPRQRQHVLSLRRGMNEAEKLAQRLVKMSIPRSKRSGGHENIISAVKDCQSKISSSVPSGQQFRLHFESSHLYVNVSRSVLHSLVTHALQMHVGTVREHEHVHVNVWQDSCLNSKHEVIDVIAFELTSSGEESLVIDNEFISICLKTSDVEWKVEKQNQTRILKVLFPAVKSYSSHSSELPLQTLRDFEVLLVEDDPQVRTLIGRMIDPMEYSVRKTGSIQEALRVVEDDGHQLNFAIIDIKLPDGSGIELAEGIRLRFPEMPVLLITGGAYHELSACLKSDPRVSVLRKPFLPSEFEEEIHQLLKVTDHFITNA